MKQEKQKLLLIDLCARLPYGIKAQIKYYDVACELLAISANGTTYATTYGDMECLIETFVEDVRPYLFPLSSMTEEQRIEASFEFGSKKYYVNIFGDIESYHEIGDDIAYIDLENIEKYINWLNKNHFDYRGLIPMGLAIDATGLNIY